MATEAIFPAVPMRTGMYESFYLRAVSPTEPVGIWIRHTVLKAPGRRPQAAAKRHRPRTGARRLRGSQLVAVLRLRSARAAPPVLRRTETETHEGQTKAQTHGNHNPRVGGSSPSSGMA
jgi:hypothetical protein